MPADIVAIVVEVSESAIARDLGRKADLYAAANIPEYRPEYWVIDPVERRVPIHENPSAAGYLGRGDQTFETPLIAATIDGLHLDDPRFLD